MGEKDFVAAGTKFCHSRHKAHMLVITTAHTLVGKDFMHVSHNINKLTNWFSQNPFVFGCRQLYLD